jgi:hypothetical protein
MAGTGLQPANLVLIVLPFILSFIIVVVRVWRKVKENKFAIGKRHMAFIILPMC